MKQNQMSDDERKIYNSFISQTTPEIDRYRHRISVISTVIALVILGAIIWYWVQPAVSYRTSLLIGGQFYVLYGALLLALQAFSSPHTVALMSMTRWDGNPKLFAELMKSRFSARVGIYFILCGFLIQGLTMLLFRT